MRRRSQPLMFQLAIAVALIGVAALVAGCGAVSQAGPAAQGANGANEATQTSADASKTATASGQPDQVTLTLDKQRYTVRDTVVVTITNGFSQTIWAADHHTSCTMLVAEHAQGTAWAAIENCHSLRPTTLAPLSAGTTSVRLDTSGWPTGTYRITLTYSGGDEGAGGPAGIAHSVEFSIG